jgi:hypothetical protein
MLDASHEDVAVGRIIERLETAYATRRSSAEVTEAVATAREQFRDSHIRDFVPVFVERRARAILDGLADLQRQPAY